MCIRDRCTIKFTSVDDMPTDAVLLKYMRKAVSLNEPAAVAKQKAKKKVARKTTKKAAPPVPRILATAMAKKKKAKSFFDGLSPSCQREYCEWIDEAKRDATKEKRVATAIEWLAEGKTRNWKYR